MVMGLPSPNIPLHHSINNLPYKTVENLREVMTDANTNFLVSVDNKGNI